MSPHDDAVQKSVDDLLRSGKSGGALTAIGNTEKEGARNLARSVRTVDDEIILQRHAPNEHMQS